MPGVQVQAQYNDETIMALTIILNKDGVLEFDIDKYYNATAENTIIFGDNELIYIYDSDEEEITEDLKQNLVKILYHKINSEIKKEEKKINEKKSLMKGFSKYLRLDKLSRILGDDEED